MALIEFKNKPDLTTPINADNLNFNFQEVMNLIYPIGSIMIQANNTDYSDFLGFEWERTLVGKVAVGIDSTDSDFNEIGKNGGSKSLQSHSHKIFQKNRSGAEYQVVGSYATTGGSYLSILGTNGATDYNGAIDYQLYTNNAGNGDAGNLQPYEVVAFWKRIA